MDIILFKSKIKKSCLILKEKDNYLFSSKQHEETINHRLAFHLSSLFDSNVDVEYSLNGDDLKMNQQGKRIRPDIVIHSRGGMGPNIGILEVKRFTNTRCDRLKIQSYNNLRYKYGVTIKFDKYGNLINSKSSIFIFETKKWLSIMDN